MGRGRGAGGLCSKGSSWIKVESKRKHSHGQRSRISIQEDGVWSITNSKVVSDSEEDQEDEDLELELEDTEDDISDDIREVPESVPESDGDYRTVPSRHWRRRCSINSPKD
ncbi:hypothetical protein L2E82_43451 [Cichorium intybus]|uniref:Uncharacterized protein n=1 Tax=Cichorium intybus TaxID=13427 RepID=A0ACB8ZMN7_CICIN|nr:hypothetical protein L2E82_43451 [Cichorium intybus]